MTYFSANTRRPFDGTQQGCSGQEVEGQAKGIELLLPFVLLCSTQSRAAPLAGRSVRRVSPYPPKPLNPLRRVTAAGDVINPGQTSMAAGTNPHILIRSYYKIIITGEHHGNTRVNLTKAETLATIPQLFLQPSHIVCRHGQLQTQKERNRFRVVVERRINQEHTHWKTLPSIQESKTPTAR